MSVLLNKQAKQAFENVDALSTMVFTWKLMLRASNTASATINVPFSILLPRTLNLSYASKNKNFHKPKTVRNLEKYF